MLCMVGYVASILLGDFFLEIADGAFLDFLLMALTSGYAAIPPPSPLAFGMIYSHSGRSSASLARFVYKCI